MGDPAFMERLEHLTTKALAEADGAELDQAKPHVVEALNLVRANSSAVQACPLELRWLEATAKAFADGEAGKVDPYDAAGMFYSNKMLASYAYILAKLTIAKHRPDDVGSALTVSAEMTGHAYGRTKPWFAALAWTAEVRYAADGVGAADQIGKYSVSGSDAETALRIIPAEVQLEWKDRTYGLYRIQNEALKRETNYVKLAEAAQRWLDFTGTAFGTNDAKYPEAAIALVVARNRIGEFTAAEKLIDVLSRPNVATFTQEQADDLRIELAKARIGLGDIRSGMQLLSQNLERDFNARNTAQAYRLMEIANILARIYLSHENFADIQRLHDRLLSVPVISGQLSAIETRGREIDVLTEGRPRIEVDLGYEVAHFADMVEISRYKSDGIAPKHVYTATNALFHSKNTDYYSYHLFLMGLDDLADVKPSYSSFGKLLSFEHACWEFERGADRLAALEGRESSNYLDFLLVTVQCKTSIYGISVGSQERRDRSALDDAHYLVETARKQRELAADSAQSSAQFNLKMGLDRDYFLSLADLDWLSAPSGPKTTEQALEPFKLLQEATAGSVDQALARQAAQRYVKTRAPELAGQVQQREALSREWVSVGSQLSLQLIDQTQSGEESRAALEDRRSKIEKTLASIDAVLKVKAPQYFSIVNQPPLTLTETQALLRKDEAVLIVTPSEIGSHVMAITRDRLVWRLSKLTKPAIEAMVAHLRQDLDPAAARSGGGLPGFDRKTAHDLYAELIEPLNGVIGSKTHLFIAADGALSSLPFGVLVMVPPRVGEDDSDPEVLRATPWFADAHALIQIPSLGALAYLRAYNARSEGAAGETAAFAGYGNPKLDGVAVERGGARGDVSPVMDAAGFVQEGATDSDVPLMDPERLRQLHQLPGTASELEAMRAVLNAPASALHQQAAMTEHMIKQDSREGRLSHVGVVDIATHGLTANQSGAQAEPGLVFTPPTKSTPEDDGYLSASEVVGLDLTGTQWVILSACNSAAPSGKPHEVGLSGLARAFFYAGTPDLLVSHWPVFDKVAAELTSDTVRRARQPGISHAQALQAAMHALRIRPEFAHPSAWAPFTLVGDR